MPDSGIIADEEFIAGSISSDVCANLLADDRFDLSFCPDAEGVTRRKFVEWLTSRRFEPFHYRHLSRQRSASIQKIRGVLAPERGDPAGSVRIMTTSGSLMCGRDSLGWCPGQLVLTLPAHCGLTTPMDGKLAAAFMKANPDESGMSIRSGRISLDGHVWADCLGIPVTVSSDPMLALKAVCVPDLTWHPSEFVAGRNLPDVAMIPPEKMKKSLRALISGRRLFPCDMMPTTLNREWIERAQVGAAPKSGTKAGPAKAKANAKKKGKAA